MRMAFLPPYSPDFDPIKEAFLSIKAWIRANRDYARGKLSGKATCDPYSLLWEAVYDTATPEKAKGWFRDCGSL
ncbi:hypothetical protein B0H34DRAFT_662443 [Crassisporium funariophilum]|nr:hypothetical protein B0H34DRAFT_662443 [Crassisporium funariophilum]